MQVRLCEIVSDVEHIDIEKIVKVLDTQKPFKDYAYILHNKDMDLCQDFGHKKLNYSLPT